MRCVYTELLPRVQAYLHGAGLSGSVVCMRTHTMPSAREGMYGAMVVGSYTYMHT